MKTLLTAAIAPAPNSSAAKPGAAPGAPARDPELWATAKKFETVFVAEMLKQAKIGDVSGGFAGGYGADAYRSFLVDAYAEAATSQQSFGLAETLYAQLRAKVGVDGP